MNKRLAKPHLSDKKKGGIVMAVAIALAALNLVPLHHFSRGNCPHGGTYTTSGTSMGLPLSYYETWHGGMNDCYGFVGDAPSSGFSAQALLGDGLVFGLVMVGVNVLLDRRTAV
ncbi:MAG TPA: hypothetical protein VLF69_03795 [Candidatus Saccharimonadales bacterium]|nr:hypothetical protein [Candidatus Saccharimonadales bacterium]